MNLISGAVYQYKYMGEFVLIYFVANSKYGMLHIDESAIKGLTAPSLQGNKAGEYFFTERELQRDWDSDNWELVDKKLIITNKQEIMG